MAAAPALTGGGSDFFFFADMLEATHRNTRAEVGQHPGGAQVTLRWTISNTMLWGFSSPATIPP